MATDVIAALGLDKDPVEKIYTVREINGADSSFITSCILSYQIKKNNTTILLPLHNSVSHYQNVGLKMGYNLNKYIDLGLVKILDTPKEFVDNFLNDGVDLNNVLDDLVIKIKNEVVNRQCNETSVCVFIDGVSHLFDLGCNVVQVNKFCKRIVELVDEFDDIFLVFQCFVGTEEDLSCVMSNLLSQMSYTVVDVQNLSTGRSADVSGHLVVKHPGWRFEEEHSFNLNITPFHYHFKLFDRGVKLFAPGAF